MTASERATVEQVPGRDRRPAAFTLLVLLVLVGPAAASAWAPSRATAVQECVTEELRIATRVPSRPSCAPSWLHPVARDRSVTRPHRPRAVEPGRYAWPPTRAPDRIARVR